jgi:hypothetical protein
MASELNSNHSARPDQAAASLGAVLAALRARRISVELWANNPDGSWLGLYGFTRGPRRGRVRVKTRCLPIEGLTVEQLTEALGEVLAVAQRREGR